MARGRRPEDWDRDLEAARPAERALAEILAADPRLGGFRDQTRSFDRLDFSFIYGGGRVEVDLKEKIRPSSAGLAALWPEVARDDLFVLDETVYRRIVWQGGGGYLVVHDHPVGRWVVFGPWELTLGPRLRYTRWNKLTATFSKGKVLIDLRTASHSSPQFSLDDLLSAVEQSRARLAQVEPVDIAGQSLPEVGSQG
jgi:hypothetical protein